MTLKYILDADNQPIAEPDVEVWARWMEANPERKILRKTTLDSGKVVSTVFLGLDHNYGVSGPPLLWESMLFASEDDYTDEDMQRYPSYADAVTGHEAMVAAHD